MLLEPGRTVNTGDAGDSELTTKRSGSGSSHVLVDEHRVAVGIDDHE